MAPAVLIYECPPLSARIAHRQCVHNRKAVKLAKGMGPTANVAQHHNQPRHRDPAITRILLRCCMTCPGVKALVSKGYTDPPVEWKR